MICPRLKRAIRRIKGKTGNDVCPPRGTTYSPLPKLCRTPCLESWNPEVHCPVSLAVEPFPDKVHFYSRRTPSSAGDSVVLCSVRVQCRGPEETPVTETTDVNRRGAGDRR